MAMKKNKKNMIRICAEAGQKMGAQQSHGTWSCHLMTRHTNSAEKHFAAMEMYSAASVEQPP